jgi:hypothetical protein
MIESALVYGFLTILMVVCGVFASRRQLAFERRFAVLDQRRTLSFAHLEIWLPILLFTIVFGCRYDVGVDYLQYLEWYEHGFDKKNEWFWRWITNLLSYMGVPYWIYFSLWAFIQIFFIYYTIKNKRYLFPYIALFIIIGNIFLPMMNTIRFMVAAAIFFYAIKYIIERCFLKYLCLILLATLFHKTAIVLIAIYPFLNFIRGKNLNRQIQFSLLLLMGVLMIYEESTFKIITSIFSKAIELFNYQKGYNYAVTSRLELILHQGEKFGRNSGLGQYIILFIGSVIIYYSPKLYKYYKEDLLFKYAYILWFCSFLIGLLVQHSFVLNRPLLYFTYFKLLVFAYFMYYCFKSNSLEDKIVGVIFVLIHMALFINIISMGEVNKSAFTFFWQH